MFENLKKSKKFDLLMELKKSGISDKSVLNAIEIIDRSLFVDENLKQKSNLNIALPIDCGQTISQPYTVAFQTEKLDINEGEKILEIGTGSGYQTAILIYLKTEVYSVERIFELKRKAKTTLSKLKLKPKKIIWADGYLGFEEKAPFDKILVTAASKEIPMELLKQLKINGKMIIPIGDLNQKMILIKKTDANNFEKIDLGSFKFVPMLKKTI